MKFASILLLCLSAISSHATAKVIKLNWYGVVPPPTSVLDSPTYFDNVDVARVSQYSELHPQMSVEINTQNSKNVKLHKLVVKL